MLYLVSTPIGNLSDITKRALDTLKEVDYILCEDTRHTLQLLNHFEIKNLVKSFHKFNEKSKEDEIILDLQEGKKIALVSDAGTPGISDPGEKLVARCIQEKILVTPIPGASALIAALSSSGLSTTKFQFIGFLPKKANALKEALTEALNYSGTTICYESPHRLMDILKTLHTLFPHAYIVIARELTKKFEEFLRGKPEELLKHFESHGIKGEIVLLIQGSLKKEPDWENLSPKEHVEYLEKTFHLSHHDAIKMAAEIRGVPKREVYNKLLKDF